MDEFNRNLRRLLGLHGLDAKQAAAILEMSESAFSKWASGQRKPSFETALKVGDLFQINAERLARAPFEDLLSHELSDPERFRSVENTVESMMRERGLPVGPDKPREKVTPIKARRAKRARA